jgi:hypothetical protein
VRELGGSQSAQSTAGEYAWKRTPKGLPGTDGLYLDPRDLAKIGCPYLKERCLGGEQAF